MKRNILKSMLVSSLLIFATVAAALPNERHFDFFTDAGFTNEVGYRIVYCDDTTESAGTTAEYRKITTYNCDSGGVGIVCAQYENGVWVTISCP